MFFGILTLVTALAISAVAIYYSVAGLVAIFAAAAVPIMIMGSVLEIAKLVTAVWLHRYWRKTSWWLKGYLSTAVVVLMFITSMGIFGFLSSAHIEQTASATESVAQIERIDAEVARQQSQIERSRLTIESTQSAGNIQDSEIQIQIDLEQERIDSAYQRVQPAIDQQQSVVEQEQLQTQKRIQNAEIQLSAVDKELENLRSALAADNIELAQSIVGVKVDGDLGPNTEAAIENFRSEKQSDRQKLADRIDRIRTQDNPDIENARKEIQRLRSLTEQQIADSNNLISRLRSQIGTVDQSAIDQEIQDENAKIDQAQIKIDNLLETKYELEVEYRKLEAEVGPVKYIAEFVYGDAADKDLLEEAVRWVILIIIFVFDPLAVLLLIASQQTFELRRRNPELQNNDTEEQDNGKFDRVDNIGNNGTEESENESDPVVTEHRDRDISTSESYSEPDTVDNEESVLVYSEPEPDPQVIAESFVSKKKI